MIRRRVSTFLFVLGVLMIAEATITVAWQEPVSAFLQNRAQGTLERELDELDSKPLSLNEAGRQELKSIRGAKRRLDRRLDLLAGELARKAGEGAAVGRLEIDRIDLNAVVVNGTSDASLRKAPGHYRGTVMPGQRGSAGIAGHRTSYGAPFRRVDKLRVGDSIVVTMPYGRFSYRVQGKKIVSPGQSEAFQRVSYQRLVLSACHPLYSASQRILVFARLESRRPLGSGVDPDEQKARRMVFHADPEKRYRRQLRRLGKRDLALGMKGKDVRELQRLLGVPRTGTFDALTAAAVTAFQRENKLPADGQAGRATKRKLARRPRPPSRPFTPPAVAPAPPPPGATGATGQRGPVPPGQAAPQPPPPG
jgi:sortase A